MFIEGIGDEVIFFALGAFFVLLLIILAWKSTEVPEPRPLTIRILSNQGVRHAQSTNSTQPQTAEPVSGQDSVTASSNFPDLINVPRDTSSSSPTEDLEVNESEGAENTSLCVEEREQSSPNNIPKPENCNGEEPGTSSNDVEESTCSLRQRIKEKSKDTFIKIRLKYIDDTQKIVEASHQMSLGDFKRQHFQAEVAANKTVKLIYNAKVLEDETTSLSQLGLDDNCVVHCLVINRPPASTTPASQSSSGASRHQTNMPSNQPSSEQTDSTRSPSGSSTPQIEAGIDVGGLLVPLFGVMMGLIWYCRIAYAAHFTTATTVALVGLSGLFLFSFFICFPIG